MDDLENNIFRINKNNYNTDNIEYDNNEDNFNNNKTN